MDDGWLRGDDPRMSMSSIYEVSFLHRWAKMFQLKQLTIVLVVLNSDSISHCPDCDWVN